METEIAVRPITTYDELRAVIGEASKPVWDKDIAHIDEHARTLIEHSPFHLLSTSAPDGTCDVSPRGDPAGSVLVLDDHTLVIADRPGNKRVDSFTNIIDNPNVGLLFLVPGMNETLRINGTATLAADGPFFDALTVQGKRPRLAVVVHVNELFLHCAKALLRSSLWKPESWPSRDSLPSAGRIFKDHMRIDAPVQVVDDDLDHNSATCQY